MDKLIRPKSALSSSHQAKPSYLLTYLIHMTSHWLNEWYVYLGNECRINQSSLPFLSCWWQLSWNGFGSTGDYLYSFLFGYPPASRLGCLFPIGYIGKITSNWSHHSARILLFDPEVEKVALSTGRNQRSVKSDVEEMVRITERGTKWEAFLNLTGDSTLLYCHLVMGMIFSSKKLSLFFHNTSLFLLFAVCLITENWITHHQSEINPVEENKLTISTLWPGASLRAMII